jgi:hypothetical protein
VVDAVVASIQSEVSGAGTWAVYRYDPVWRNPREGTVLRVWCEADYPSQEQMATGYTEDSLDVRVEYAKATGTILTSDEAAVLALYDTFLALKRWARTHGAGFPDVCHAFEYVRTDFAGNERGERFWNVFEMRFLAKRMEDYAP